jgi:sugar fermentation stimulation protein A
MLAVVIGGNGKGEHLVSLDTRLPNRLVREALLNNRLEEFGDYGKVTAEYPYGLSRLDFLLEEQSGNKDSKCLLEVKSCNLVVGDVALFPDAPTERGSRHLKELMKAKSLDNRYRTCIMFIVQRDDANSFEPNRRTDPKFAKNPCRALAKEVEAYAYTVHFKEDSMTLARSIPIRVSGS